MAALCRAEAACSAAAPLLAAAWMEDLLSTCRLHKASLLSALGAGPAAGLPGPLRERLEGKDGDSLAVGALNVGVTYRLLGRKSEALAAFERAGRLFTLRRLDASAVFVSLLLNIGAAHELNGDCPAALAGYERALALCRRTLPADHPHLAACPPRPPAPRRSAGVRGQDARSDGAQPRHGGRPLCRGRGGGP